MSLRHSPTAPTISLSAARSAWRRSRARPPRRSNPPLPLFFLEQLLEQPLEVGMDRKLRAVKQHLLIASLFAHHTDRREILDIEVADFVGLILDIDPAESGGGEFLGQLEEPGTVLDAGIAPFGAKTAHDHHA